MRSHRFVAFLVVFAVSAALGVPAAAMSRGGSDTGDHATYYLALGDSAPVWNGNHSYPNLIVASSVTRKWRDPKLANLACVSETTVTFVYDSLCGGSQLTKAEAFLRAHRGHVGLVTIDIGGNDVLPCASISGIDWNCALTVLASIEQNVHTIMRGLRSASGSGVPIVGMNYYDPFLGYWLAGDIAHPIVTDTVAGTTLLNERLAHVYSGANAQVANVQDAFETTELVHTTNSHWGRVPVAVARGCTLLDITCAVGQLEGFGDDPNVSGAAVIAHTFEHLLGAVPAPRHH